MRIICRACEKDYESEEIPVDSVCPPCRKRMDLALKLGNPYNERWELAGQWLADKAKIAAAIELLERLERECLVPDFAHDAFGTCPTCRLLKELKAQNH